MANDILIAANTRLDRTAAVVTAQGTIQDPPPSLSRIEVGQTIKGTVIGLDDKGRVLLRSEHGTLTVATNLRPPLGSELILQVRQNGPALQIVVLKIDPPTPLPLENVLRSSETPTPNRIADHLQIDQKVKATIQAPPQASVGLPRAAGTLTAGDVLTLRILGIGVPKAATPSNLPQQSAGSPAVRAPSLPNSLPTAAQSQALPQGGVVPTGRAQTGAQPTPVSPTPLTTSAAPNSSAQVTNPQANTGQASAPRGVSGPTQGPSAPPPGQVAQTLERAGQLQASVAHRPIPQTITPSPASATGTVPQPTIPAVVINSGPSDARPGPLRFTAQVTALGSRGGPILSSPIGRLQIATPLPIPIGASLAFELPEESLSTSQSNRAFGQTHLWPKTWPAMHELAAIVAADSALRSAMDTATPRFGNRLTAGLLLFLGALRGGFLEGWLSPQLQALIQQRPGRLVERLGDDFARMTGRVEAGGLDWRVHYIPVFGDHVMEQVRLYLRERMKGGGQRENEQDNKASRFVIEAELRQWGRLQFDGLVLNRKKRFDLVLRSETELDARLRQTSRQLFFDALRSMEHEGELSFQSLDQGPRFSAKATQNA